MAGLGAREGLLMWVVPESEIAGLMTPEAAFDAVAAKIKASRCQPNDSILGDNVFEICRAADITFFALHGEDGENGTLQAAFDVAGIRYTGCGCLGSAIAMNKEVSKKLFLQAGIGTPAGITPRRECRLGRRQLERRARDR